MPAVTTFAYESRTIEGKRAKGNIEAVDRAAAQDSLFNQGMIVMSLDEAGSGLHRELHIPGLGNSVGPKDLSLFARQFSTMTSSGLPLMRALSILEQQAGKEKLAVAIRKVRTDVQGGSSLSGAMGAQADVFPTLMVNLVQAGETGGFLDQALRRIADTYESEAKLRSSVKAALTYPVVVLIFSLLMVVGVLVFIVPIFEKMFASLNGTLPLPTRILVSISHAMIWLGPVLLALAILAVLGFRRAVQKPEVRLAVDRFKLRVPVFGPLMTKVAISRFARNFGTLLAVGVPVLQALDAVAGATGNAAVGAVMKDIGRSVRHGGSMADPLHRTELVPPMVAQMMEVGEETGQVGLMLDKLADFYDHEVETSTAALTAALEPIMIVVLGGVVGSMLICLYLPMFTIYQNIES
ncbi:MAG: pilC [Jatrophihabitantaceae bacterium]|nr:pilC [Jatrophihabitantaceae bacterium]